VPLELRGLSGREVIGKGRELLERVDWVNAANINPVQLSGGRGSSAWRWRAPS